MAGIGPGAALGLTPPPVVGPGCDVLPLLWGPVGGLRFEVNELGVGLCNETGSWGLCMPGGSIGLGLLVIPPG